MRRKAAHHATARGIQKHCLNRRGVYISESTARRVLGSGRNPMRWAPLKRGKLLSRINKDLRVQFCRARIGFDFSNVVFMDAKDLYLYYDDVGYAHHCWQSIEKPPPPVHQSNPFVFRFYAAVGMGFKSCLHFVPPSPAEGSRQHKSQETYKSNHYISMMGQLGAEIQQHYQEREYVIIQDHARQHTSSVSKKAMEEKGFPFMEDFPAQSWDLNIIENVWGILDGKLLKMKASTTEGWRNNIKRAWNMINQTSIDKLVEGLPDRMGQIIHAGGAWVSHH
jgi:hypothetical protein